MTTRVHLVLIVSCVFASTFSEWLRYDGKIYYFSHIAQPLEFINYTEAVEACSEQHGGAQLVSINSEAENRFLTNNGYSRLYWIGLKCETGPCDVADLRWADGSRVTYNNGGLSQINGGRAVVLFAARNLWYVREFNYLEY